MCAVRGMSISEPQDRCMHHCKKCQLILCTCQSMYSYAHIETQFPKDGLNDPDS